MRTIKNCKLWKIIIVSIILVGFISGAAYHGYSLWSDLEKVTAENKQLEEALSSTMSELEAIKAELDTVKEDLAAVTEESRIQSETIKRQVEEIDSLTQEIEDEEAKWRQRYEEYPVATEAWIAMKTYGWSDTVCAGIMGNLMAETGGTGTLYLDWDSNGGNGYGLVQWIGGRRSTIKSRYGTYPTVKEQVQFIHDELFGANGVRQQVTISQLDAIMTAETPEECAYAFACYYERCADFARSMRRGFARKAYEYFVE